VDRKKGDAREIFTFERNIRHSRGGGNLDAVSAQAEIRTANDGIKLLLDSGYQPAADSGMTVRCREPEIEVRDQRRDDCGFLISKIQI